MGNGMVFSDIIASVTSEPEFKDFYIILKTFLPLLLMVLIFQGVFIHFPRRRPRTPLGIYALVLIFFSRALIFLAIVNEIVSKHAPVCYFIASIFLVIYACSYIIVFAIIKLIKCYRKREERLLFGNQINRKQLVKEWEFVQMDAKANGITINNAKPMTIAEWYQIKASILQKNEEIRKQQEVARRVQEQEAEKQCQVEYARQQEAARRAQEQETERQRQAEYARQQEAARRAQEQKTKQKNQAEQKQNTNSSTQDYFSGCTTVEQLKARHRQLVKKYHPDTGKGNIEICKIINAQYEEQLKHYK